MVNNGCKLGRQKMEQLLWRQNSPNSQADWGELGRAWNSLCMLWRGSWLRHVVELHHDFGCPPCWARMASWQLKIDWTVVYEPRALLALRLSLPQSHFLFWPHVGPYLRQIIQAERGLPSTHRPAWVIFQKGFSSINLDAELGELLELLVSIGFIICFHMVSQYLLIAF